ncbi:O-antigen ligase family protein [Cnuibacter sp. UC19_7]|uniref:O-antigen ligase family protein n=1 Tax=Cnuibacter sp. UC19_7 TaxID=3350166 RepID=UPI0036708463
MATKVNQILPRSYLLGIVVVVGALVIAAIFWGGVTVPIALLLLGGVFAAALRWPLFAWAAYLIAINVNGLIVVAGGVSIKPEIVGLLLLLLALRKNSPSSRLSQPARVGGGAVVVALLLLLSLFLASVLRAPESDKSLWIWIQFSMSVVAFLMIAHQRAIDPRFIRIGNVVVGAICLVSLTGFVGALVGVVPPGTMGVGPDMRLIGFSIETNIFAAQVVSWLAVVWCVRVRPSRWERALLIVMVLAVLLAGTRSAWLAGAVLLAAMLGSHFRRSMWSLLISSVLLVLAATTPAVIGVIAAGSPPDSLAWRLNNLMSFDTGTGAYRVNIYDTAWAEIVTWPRWLVGSGMNSYSQFHPIDATNQYAEYLGNVWLALLYDGGVIAALLFVVLLIITIRSAALPGRSAVTIAAVLLCSTATNIIWFQFAWVAIGLSIHGRALDRDPMKATDKKAILASTPALGYRT